ncbi:MAG: NAD(P)H-hydrate dehydratase [Aeromicrobium sp.]
MLTAFRIDDIRAAEKAAMAKLPAGELMQRAAHGLAEALADIPAGELVIVLAGPGDNGGDALFTAKHLLDRGVRVDVALVDPDRVHRDGLAAAVAAGAEVIDEPSAQRWCVDGLYGIGARPGLSGRAARWAAWAASSAETTIAVDVPSGVDVDGGTLSGDHVVADRTVTFGAHKVSLLAGPAADAAGAVTFVDIGLDLGEPALEALEAGDGHLLAPAVPRPGGHKYTRGVVGIAAGSDEYPGAAHLVVAGAQAGTAGMLRFVGSAALGARVVDRAPEVVLSPGRIQAWVVGPGGGPGAREQLATALAFGVPAVIDADALEAIPSRLQIPAVLTPHAGELASMLGTSRDAIEADPLRAVTQAAERWACTVLLKGARTLIATPGLPTRVNRSGTPWLGTAGSGDVLAGFIGSLLASGLDPHDAASVGAYLHGRAAEAIGGPLTARDIAATLPRMLSAFIGGGV